MKARTPDRSALQSSGTLRTRCSKAKFGSQVKWPRCRSSASSRLAGRATHSKGLRQVTVWPSTSGVTVAAISPMSW